MAVHPPLKVRPGDHVLMGRKRFSLSGRSFFIATDLIFADAASRLSFQRIRNRTFTFLSLL